MSESTSAPATGIAAGLSPESLAKIDKAVAKYPPDQKQSAVMACLSIVQQEQGHVSPEAEKAVAEVLGMPPIAVHEVTTFYNMYNQQAVGRYKLNQKLPHEYLLPGREVRRRLGLGILAMGRQVQPVVRDTALPALRLLADAVGAAPAA